MFLSSRRRCCRSGQISTAEEAETELFTPAGVEAGTANPRGRDLIGGTDILSAMGSRQETATRLPLCNSVISNSGERTNLRTCQTATGTTKTPYLSSTAQHPPARLSTPHLYHLSPFIDHLRFLLLFHLRTPASHRSQYLRRARGPTRSSQCSDFPQTRPCDLEQVSIIMPFHCRTPQWRLALLGPLILGIFSTLAQSSAAVNVALKTSFDAAPYLIELL